MPQAKTECSPIPISWQPECGWVILIPSRLPETTEAGVVLPESYIQKSNSGICVKISADSRDEALQHFLGRECFFPQNQEYRVRDSDTDTLYYIVLAEHIIMSRVPPRKTSFVRVLSEERAEDAGKDTKSFARLQK